MNRDQIADAMETSFGRFVANDGAGRVVWRARFLTAADAIMALDGWEKPTLPPPPGDAG